MQRFGLPFLLLFMLCVLTACSYLEHGTLFNNTSGEVTVVMDGYERTVIPRDGHAKISYIIGRSRQVSVSSGACDYVYDIPSMPNSYRPDRKLDRGIQFQMEKDFSIYLLPAHYAGDMPASRDVFMPRDGFPLQPILKKCR